MNVGFAGKDIGFARMNVGFAGIDIGFARMDVVAVLRRIWSF
jgi:hypothetical protein